jgi:pimeloyl-ACP methyl ester carboxylesterase
VAAVVHVAPPLDPDLEFGIGWRKFLDFPLFHLVTPPAFRVCNQELITLKIDLEDLMPRWQDLRVPIYLIQGTADNLVSPKELTFFSRMAPPAMQHAYPHPGDHFIYWTDVPFVLDVIDDALKEMSR